LDALYSEIEVELQERGVAVVSTVVVSGRKHLHAAITNHRTRRADLEMLVWEVLGTGKGLAA